MKNDDASYQGMLIINIINRDMKFSRILEIAEDDISTVGVSPVLDPVMVPVRDPVIVPVREPVIVPVRETVDPVFDPVIVPPSAIVASENIRTVAVNSF